MAIIIIFNTTDRPVEIRLFHTVEQNIWNSRASTGLSVVLKMIIAMTMTVTFGEERGSKLITGRR